MVSNRDDSAPDSNEGRPLGLGAFIRERRDEILAAWEQGVQRIPVASRLDRPTLIDHVPDLLARIAMIADELGSGKQPQLPADVAEAHAIERLSEGFDLAQVSIEFSVLRDCITRLWEEREEPRHVIEFRVLNQSIDKAVTASIERYTKARDRTLEALDRISNAALESKSLDDFLQRLLAVLVDATPAVDICTILLREDGQLRVRASIGLEGEEAELAQPVTELVGEGFAGTIAATRQPLEAGPGTPMPAAMAAAGVRALYGLPLADGGEVIAVAHMASRKANEFSKQDKKLFAAMTSRATTAIFQHVLREHAQRAMSALREREQEFRALADNIPQLAWMTDAHGAAYWFNRRWLEYTGRSLEQSWVSGTVDLQHPDHLPRVSALWEQARSAGQPWQDTFPLRGKDGRYRWFLSRAIPIHDDEGTVVRWLGTNTDVTEQRFLDEATRLMSGSLNYNETLEQLAQLAVPDLADLCIVDLADEDVTRVAIAHADPSQIERARAWVPSGVSAVIRAGQTEYVAEIGDAMPGARELGLRSCIIVPLIARQRTLGALTLFTSDASGRRYHESEVAVAKELGRRAGIALDNARLYNESQQAIRTREEVLAIVSHDLRNPLNTIDLTAAHLLEDYGSIPGPRRHLEVIRRSAERMEHLINDLLDMATIDAKGLSLHLSSQRVAKLVTDVVETHESLAAERGVKLVIETELGDERLRCDRDRIEQVFANLLGNAIKYCRPGDVVVVRAAIVGGWVNFGVADTGPGITAEELPHLFQPYWAAKRELAKRGTGLGLYICKGIVEAHGGTIWVESEHGAGTTFCFTIPFARAPTPRPA